MVVVDDDDEIFGKRKKSKFSQGSIEKRSSLQRSLRESAERENNTLGPKRRSLQEISDENYLS